MSESTKADTDNHKVKDLFRCSTCWKSFTEENACYDHMLSHLQQTPDNGTVVHNGTSLYQTIIRKRKKKYVLQTKCITCDKECGTTEKLKEHKKIHRILKIYGCEICGRSFTQGSSLTRHKLSHSDVRPFQCEFCGKAYKAELELKFHLCLHTRKGLVKCEECGKELVKPGQLKAHQLCHSEERPFVCEVCGFRTKTQGNLVHHSAVHDSSRSRRKQHKCDKCYQIFNRKQCLDKHICIRSKQKSIQENDQAKNDQTLESDGFDHDYFFCNTDQTVGFGDSAVCSLSKYDKKVGTSVRQEDSSTDLRQNSNKEGQSSGSSLPHHAGRGTLLQIALPQSVANGQTGQVKLITMNIKKKEFK